MILFQAEGAIESSITRPTCVNLQEVTLHAKMDSPPHNEYAPLDLRTRSWEVAREDVIVETIIGKGAFGQVAKGTAKNLSFRSGRGNVAIKMLKGVYYQPEEVAVLVKCRNHVFKIQCSHLYSFKLQNILSFCSSHLYFFLFECLHCGTMFIL